MNNLISKYSATAVVSHPDGYFLAVNGGILLLNKTGKERKVLDIDVRILDLKCSGDIIYGIGDNGVFIRSKDCGLTWEKRKLSTSGSIWSISCNEKGLVAAHGQHVVFLSRDFGRSWKIIKIFKNLENPPAIRSLYLDDYTLYIGTKIHAAYGGIWSLDLQKYRATQIKSEKSRMIASIQVHNQFLVAASGSCKGNKGSVDFCEIPTNHTESYRWQQCLNYTKENCYLDLSEDNGYLYTSTSKDQLGKGKVFQVSLKEKLLIPCGLVNGHGWRIANKQQEYLVAGLYESSYSK